MKEQRIVLTELHDRTGNAESREVIQKIVTEWLKKELLKSYRF